MKKHNLLKSIKVLSDPEDDILHDVDGYTCIHIQGSTFVNLQNFLDKQKESQNKEASEKALNMMFGKNLPLKDLWIDVEHLAKIKWKQK